MSATRIWAAVVGVALAILLVVVAVVSFGPEQTVVPEVSVTRQKLAGDVTTGNILAERTRMQRWREQSGPSPESGTPEGEAGNEERLKFTPGVNNPEAVVQSWQENRPDDAIMRPSENVIGISSLPYFEAETFEQPGGRNWRAVHNDQVKYGGGWIIFGIGLALALFLFLRGRIPLESGFSGKSVERFNSIERANHWMTASAFILMALTGIILLYGKALLLPVIGHDATGWLARGSAWLHMAAAVPFVIGVLLMIVLWVADNIPRPLDWTWLKKGGGFLRNGEHPHARKFNAGQKIVFWGVTLGGLALLASGLTLMFPFFWFGYDGMQLAQTSHAVIGLFMIALIIGHIYIGTVGMVGAFDAMWSGQVDRNWAKEHHDLWYERIAGRKNARVSRKSG